MKFIDEKKMNGHVKGFEKTMNPPQEIRVSDLQLAAYLLARGFKLLRAEGSPSRVTFIFEAVSDEVVFSYYRGEDQISARSLFNTYRDLKGLTVQHLSR
ncbi:MAG: hypothetical protein HY347_09110 [candidate division NC10 bacterium]|nr:hypothetical protein [candidate division NC10 bacterium]